MMKNSLRSKLMAAFTGLAIIPLIFVSAVLTWLSYTVQQRQSMAFQRVVTDYALVRINAFVSNVESELRVSAQVAELRTADRPGQERILSTLLFYKNSFDELALLGSDGRELVRVSRMTNITTSQLRDRSEAKEFTSPLESHQTYYGSVRFNPTSGEPTLLMAVPLEDARSGQVDHVITAQVRLKPVWDVVAGIQVGETGTVTIVDADGRVVAHRDASVVLRDTRFTLPATEGIHPGITGTEAVLTFAPVTLGAQKLYLVAELPVREALAPAIRSLATTGALLIVTLVIAWGIGQLTVRRIVRPLQALAHATQAISAGNMMGQVKVVGHDEIGRLARAFNAMTIQLRQTLEGLEERVARRTRDLEARNAELAHAYEDLREQQSHRLIAEQTVRELGSPTIPVLPGVLLIPLVGLLTTERAQQFVAAALAGVIAHQARVMLLDLTGMTIADMTVAESIIAAANAASLLGTRTILVGVRPEIAQSMISLGLDLSHFATQPTLEAALQTLDGPRRTTHRAHAATFPA